MAQLCRCFSQTIGNKAFLESLNGYGIGNSTGKNTYLVGYARGKGTNKIRETKTWFPFLGVLLAKEGYPLTGFEKNYVLTIGISLKKADAKGGVIPSLVPLTQQLLCFVKKLHGLFCPFPFLFRKSLQPILETGYTSVNSGYAAITGGETPSMKEIKPVYVTGCFVNGIVSDICHWSGFSTKP
jgi:hypothetical protein